jgi:tight adherence protein C
MNTASLLLAALLAATAAALACWYAWRYLSGVRLPKVADRSYMDPLPALVRLVWPLVAFYLQLIRDQLGEKTLLATQARIDSAGLRYTLRADEFIALRFAFATLGVGIGVLFALGELNETIGMPFAFNVFLACSAGALGYLYPGAWAAAQKKRYTRNVMRALPGYLDMITMCCEAGLNLNGALQQAVSKGPDGPLRRELERVLREMRAGVSRTEALRSMAERMDNPIITNLVSNIIQSELMGASLAVTLRSISELRRVERFQIAEKAAMEAPVKMIFPLVIFIFPVTFLIIAFPLLIKAREML